MGTFTDTHFGLICYLLHFECQDCFTIPYPTTSSHMLVLKLSALEVNSKTPVVNEKPRIGSIWVGLSLYTHTLEFGVNIDCSFHLIPWPADKAVGT